MDVPLQAAVFTQAEVVKLTGINAATLQNWVNRSILKLKEQNPGRRSRRYYRQLDIIRVISLLELCRVGMSVTRAAEFTEEVVVKQALEEEKDRQALGNKSKYVFKKAEIFYQSGKWQENLYQDYAINNFIMTITNALRRPMVMITIDVGAIVLHVQSMMVGVDFDENDKIRLIYEEGEHENEHSRSTTEERGGP